MECIKCNQKFCFYHSNAHTPDVLCETFEGSIGIVISEDSLVKSCPNCGAVTEKFEGCNHMSCAYCQIEWCWLCGKIIKNGGNMPFHFSWWNPFGCTGQ